MRSSIAGHPWQKEIDAAILSGQSKRAIAKRFGLSSTAVQRRKHQLTLSNPPEPILVLPPQHSQSAAISQYPVSADPHPPSPAQPTPSIPSPPAPRSRPALPPADPASRTNPPGSLNRTWWIRTTKPLISLTFIIHGRRARRR
jgi:hypothetical protein